MLLSFFSNVEDFQLAMNTHGVTWRLLRAPGYKRYSFYYLVSMFTLAWFALHRLSVFLPLAPNMVISLYLFMGHVTYRTWMNYVTQD